jgi:DNA transposition AAA+ family ATPase
MVTPATATETPAAAAATGTRHKPEAPAVAGTPGFRGFNIRGDTIKAAIADLPDDQRDLVWWFAQWAGGRNLSRADLGTVLKKPSGDYYSTDSVVQFLTGGRARRGENVQPILDAIAQLRRVEGERESQANSGFIETRLFGEISRRCRRALLRQRIMFIFGDSQIGKTWSLKEYQRRNNHGQTIYVEVPTGGSLGAFLRALGKAFNLPQRVEAKQLADRIIDCFDDKMLLIVDEAHRLPVTRKAVAGLAVYSFLRELWNRKQCGIVISMTNEGRDDFLKGPYAKQLEQLWRRRIAPLQLPNVTPDDDAALFAEAYGLPVAPDETVHVEITAWDQAGNERKVRHSDNPLRLQREVLKTEGLGVWIGMLQDASDMAAEAKRQVTWAAVLKAHAQAQADADIYK